MAGCPHGLYFDCHPVSAVRITFPDSRREGIQLTSNSLLLSVNTYSLVTAWMLFVLGAFNVLFVSLARFPRSLIKSSDTSGNPLTGSDLWYGHPRTSIPLLLCLPIPIRGRLGQLLQINRTRNSSRPRTSRLDNLTSESQSV
jgi:hypothetical protein